MNRLYWLDLVFCINMCSKNKYICRVDPITCLRKSIVFRVAYSKTTPAASAVMRTLPSRPKSSSNQLDLAALAQAFSDPTLDQASRPKRQSSIWDRFKQPFRRPNVKESSQIPSVSLDALPPAYPSPSEDLIASPSTEPINCLDELTPIALQPDDVRFRKKSTHGSRRGSECDSIRNLNFDGRIEGKSYGNLFRRSRKSSIAPSFLKLSDSTPDEQPYFSCPGLDRRTPEPEETKLGFFFRNRSQSVDATTYSLQSKKNHKVLETSTIYFMNEQFSCISPTGEVETCQGKVNQYHLLRDIGSGAYGKVVLCRNEQTGRYYACKIISKNRLKKKFRWHVNADHLESVKREIAILKKISKHRNINALVEVLDDGREDNLYMSKSF